MRRYLTFCGSYYYPMGGMNDFKGDFDSLQKAIDFLIEYVEGRYWTDIDEPDENAWYNAWAHVYDTKTKTKVWSK